MKRLIMIAMLGLAACGPAAEKAPAAPVPAVSSVQHGALAIENATAKPPIEGQTTAVGYLVIRNSGEVADKLIAAASPNAESIELHTHREVDGMKRMEKVDGVDIPAKGAVIFEPGGLHLMIFGYAPAGETLSVTLTFEKGGEVTVPFTIVARSADNGTGHAAHEGHEH